ncbi:MAG: hypothetical protein IKM35_05365 [Bacteroidaceae bacterium]|nr:hypothetical protein [Bacteroidaceae bacterium]
MRRYIYTIVLLAISIIANASPATDATINTVDTTTQDIRKFNRGLTNYRFIPQKEWICGITASYTGYNSQDSDIALLIKDFNFTGSLFGIHPFVGYFVSDNNCIGVKLGYSTTGANLGKINIDIMEDMNIALPNMAYNAKIYSAGIFHRAYLGLSRNGQVGVFNETSLTFESGTSHFIRGDEETGIQDTKTVSNQIALGLNPGISVFVLNNVSANVSVGILGLNYKQSKQYTNNIETGMYRSSGANFKINILNINIGITVHI